MKARHIISGVISDVCVVYIDGRANLLMGDELIDERHYEVVQCSPLTVFHDYSPVSTPHTPKTMQEISTFAQDWFG